ncbi:hypothetical protein BDW75DRAFT_41277 [Aspergillus navahoensis]
MSDLRLRAKLVADVPGVVWLQSTVVFPARQKCLGCLGKLVLGCQSRVSQTAASQTLSANPGTDALNDSIIAAKQSQLAKFTGTVSSLA